MESHLAFLLVPVSSRTPFRSCGWLEHTNRYDPGFLFQASNETLLGVTVTKAWYLSPLLCKHTQRSNALCSYDIQHAFGEIGWVGCVPCRSL